MVLENETEVRRRGVEPYCKFLDGDKHRMGTRRHFHPEGRGLKDAMTNALKDSKVSTDSIDYLNAHAPSTLIGDASEMTIKSIFLP